MEYNHRGEQIAEEYTLTPIFQTLIQELQKIDAETARKVKGQNLIKVSYSLSSIASVYEKMRNAVGYQQEQMLRRMAIERFFKRRIATRQPIEEIAPNLVRELIHAGYLPNNTLPEEIVDQVREIMDKYAVLMQQSAPEIHRAAIDLASAEIESFVASHQKEEALLQAFFTVMKEQWAMKDPEQQVQLLAALYEVFFQADLPTLRYYLLCYYLPAWTTATPQQAAGLTIEFTNAIARVDQILLNAEKARFNAAAKKYYPLFLTVRTIVVKYPDRYPEILSDHALLIQHVAAIAEFYYRDVLGRLHRSITKAVVFILITKITLGLILEIPYDIYIDGGINFLPLVINLLIPPILMFLSTFLVSIPGKENTQRLTVLTEELLYTEKSQVLQGLVKRKGMYRSSGASKILNGMYAVTFLAIVGLLVWALHSLGFNPISGVLFFVFLSTVSFLAFRIRRSSADLTVVEDEESGVVMVVDFLLLPFLRIGHWLSAKLKTANLFLFIFDFILEAPFKTILEMSEQWIGFMREKKDEMIP